MEPAWLLVAVSKIVRKGPGVASMTLSRAATPPDTKSKIISKIKPVNIPIPTHPIIILGPSTAAFGISSILARDQKMQFWNEMLSTYI